MLKPKGEGKEDYIKTKLVMKLEKKRLGTGKKCQQWRECQFQEMWTQKRREGGKKENWGICVGLGLSESWGGVPEALTQRG